ncbi:MAG: selenium-dependent molybdenum cofactor biosynthesis protein YqeB [Eubacteriales bacterium]|nr:selenium-dependent molybdenum cofactor biosynthesis protein YqeB [Eubacteriales bacterium]
MNVRNKVLIKGAGDLASGIALRLFRSGFDVVMTEIAVPTTVRRTVAFSPAAYLGKTVVEDVEGILCDSMEVVNRVLKERKIAVVVDEQAEICGKYKPDVVVDAILAKRNLGTRITDADTVIGVGPGFTAGEDCHLVVETKRGHYLGRCIWEGTAIPNTGVPGIIGGYGLERLIRATADGVFYGAVEIGAVVKAGDVVGYVKPEGCDGESGANAVSGAGGIAGANAVGGAGGIAGANAVSGADGMIPVLAQIDGVVRGLLQDGVPVTKGMKSGDVDPRCEVKHCFTVSDKASAIGGGVLEGILSHQAKIG